MMQALGKINEIVVRMGDIQCLMIFMVMDTNNYDLLMGLNFLIKIGAMADVEKSIIQMWQGLGNNVKILPLNMVNMMQVVKNQTQHDIIESLDKRVVEYNNQL